MVYEMLKWIAKPRYNLFDPFWMATTAIAWHEAEWVALVVFLVVGVSVSTGLERLASRAEKTG